MSLWEDRNEFQSWTWEDRVALLRRWVQTHGERLPKRVKDGEDEAYLTHWLVHVGQKFRAGNLTEKQIDQLQKVPGMTKKMSGWARKLKKSKPPVEEYCWEAGCKALKKWIELHGKKRARLNSKDGDERSIAEWLKKTQQRFCGNALNIEELRQLQDIPGMLKMSLQWEARWGPKDSWHNHRRELREWILTNNGTIPSPLDGDAVEAELATWLRVNKNKYLTGTLTAEQADSFRSIDGMGKYLSELRESDALHWEKTCESLRQWMHNNSTLPKRTLKDAEERRLANWLAKMKQHYKKDKLSVNQSRELWSIPLVPQRFEDG
eukprot:TRINITY_DN20386_c0_g1_i4.p1 TRINITY_DN20386_c0_g1~~TRINITY_DN20386_c0_g1_i4.p1  ORF type:complete len:361 (+),score=62.88 TRINITY_DN20386_c0_g1_i4:122-1084(+)